MMDAAGRRLSRLNRGPQRRQDEPRIDLAAERITVHPARLGVQNHGEVDQAGRHANVRDIADPKLMGPLGWMPRGRLGKIGPSWLLSVVRTNLRKGRTWEAILAHRARDRLAINHHTL